MTKQTLIAVLLLVIPCAAQPSVRRENELELWKMQLEQQDRERVRTANIQAFLQEKQFVERLNRFASVWTKLAGEYNEKHAINVRLAHELSKAFRSVETGEGWPVSCPPKDRLRLFRKKSTVESMCQ